MATKLSEFEEALKKDPIGSHRRLSERLEIPRTTLQHWQKRRDAVNAAPEVVAFFESPAGVEFLHRLVLAAHFTMTRVGPCGIRLVCQFLELSHLSATGRSVPVCGSFVWSSPESLYGNGASHCDVWAGVRQTSVCGNGSKANRRLPG